MAATRNALRESGAATTVISGKHPDRGILYAAIDPQAHHVEGAVADRRFCAWLSPFRSTEEAEAALTAAGGKLAR